MKKFVLGFLVGALIFSIIPVSAAVQEYVLQKSDCKLIINGKEYANKELPMLNYKGYNYIPADSFRQICEQIGAKFEWVNETKEIRIDKAESKTEDGDEISPVTQHETIDIVNADSLQKADWTPNFGQNLHVATNFLIFKKLLYRRIAMLSISFPRFCIKNSLGV